jgi:cytochrome c-type biogenesis protein CcmH
MATTFAFYAACTAILLFAMGALALPLVRRRASAGAPDDSTAKIRVYRDQLRELQRELAAGTIDAEQFAQARRELETRLGEEVGTAPPPPRKEGRMRRLAAGLAIAFAALALPTAAWWLYLKLGAPDAGIATPTVAASAGTTAATAGKSAPLPSMESLAQRLALRLRTQAPEDGQGWALLARSYTELKRYPEAADAFREAAKRITNDATLLADYADALGMANGRSLKGEPAALAQRALKLEPNHPKALALAASAAYEERNYRQAIGYWRRLAASLPPGSDELRGVQANLTEAQALMAGKPLPRAIDEQTGDAAPGASSLGVERGAISGTVRVAPALAARVSADDILLVYAKGLTGPAMPLAILRVPAAGLPLAFRLDDGQAMLPGLRLSSAGDVALTARISHNGGATPQPGDLEGALTPVRVGASGLDLVVDRVVR